MWCWIPVFRLHLDRPVRRKCLIRKTHTAGARWNPLAGRAPQWRRVISIGHPWIGPFMSARSLVIQVTVCAAFHDSFYPFDPLLHIRSASWTVPLIESIWAQSGCADIYAYNLLSPKGKLSGTMSWLYGWLSSCLNMITYSCWNQKTNLKTRNLVVCFPLHILHLFSSLKGGLYSVFGPNEIHQQKLVRLIFFAFLRSSNH